MTIILIILAVLFFYAFGVYENNKKRKEKSTAQKKERIENEYLFWHNKIKESRAVQNNMRAEAQRLKKETQLRRETQYPEYLKWCRENGEIPFVTPEKLENVIP